MGFAAGVYAQQEDVDQLHENAKAFMQQGDYGNATLILTRALQQDKQNLGIAKDLSLSYFLHTKGTKYSFGWNNNICWRCNNYNQTKGLPVCLFPML